MDSEKQKIKVFLIDDDDFLLEMYSLKFSASGFDVDIAKGSEEALKKLREGFKPDIMLLDLVMPQTDGFELLEIIRKENLIPDTIIIVLSNLGQKEDIERSKSLGAAAYLIKASLTPSEVVKKTEAILNDKQ